MKAVVFHEHGGSEVLRWEELPTPVPDPDEVLVAVHAVGVNPGPDLEARRTGFGMEMKMPHIGGTDPAGEVVAVGSSVKAFSAGDRVAIYPVIACGMCDFCVDGRGETYCRSSRLFGVHTQGGRAEYLVVPATQLVALPQPVSFEQAAALGVAYTTTWHGLVERARAHAGESLLVMGAGGGCGVAAVQFGRLLGLHVIAVSGSDWKRERLLALGADHAFSYRDPDWVSRVRTVTGGRGVSIAFDNAGSDTLAKSIDCLDRAGRLFSSGGTSGLEVNLSLRRLYREHIDLRFYVQGNKADMAHLVDLVARGELDPVVDSTFRLEDARAADDHLSSGQQFGRVVLTTGTGRDRPGVHAAEGMAV